MLVANSRAPLSKSHCLVAQGYASDSTDVELAGILQDADLSILHSCDGNETQALLDCEEDTLTQLWRFSVVAASSRRGHAWF